MPGPTLASLILGAAKDIERVGGTLDAELLLSTLLGGPGEVRPTGGYAYGDRYGDQSGYVATFESQEGEHAVVFLVDHTLGMVKDILVIAPASAVRDQFASDTDEMSWSAPLDPA